jgi:hypothetical protein
MHVVLEVCPIIILLPFLPPTVSIKPRFVCMCVKCVFIYTVSVAAEDDSRSSAVFLFFLRFHVRFCQQWPTGRVGKGGVTHHPNVYTSTTTQWHYVVASYPALGLCLLCG